MFKVNNKDTRMTPYSSVCIVNFEQVNADLVYLSPWKFFAMIKTS